MSNLFKDDFFWMLRENKGYFPWLQDQTYRLARHVRFGHSRQCPMCDDRRATPRECVRAITETRVCDNPLFDIVMKALIRAEVRFISRFIPQRSHEERLTGNLVSEIDSAIYLVKRQVHEISLARYAAAKDVDFFYYDLSRSGKLEKATGADLGFVLLVDLPDFPYTVKSLILQVKKIDGPSATIDRTQYETLQNNGMNGCAYLLLDMHLARRCAPLVVMVDGSRVERWWEYPECVKNGHQSFNYPFDKAKSYGHPLSLFITSNLAYDDSVGVRHKSFKDALKMFSQLGANATRKADVAPFDFNGRLAIVSIGRSIQFTTIDNERFDIEV